MTELLAGLPGWLRPVLAVAIAAAGALILHQIAFGLFCRAARRTRTEIDNIALRRLGHPTRWLVLAIALSAVQPALALNPEQTAIWRRVAGLITPALVGWLAIALLRGLTDVIEQRSDITVADNLRARRRRTRIGILYRIAVFLVLLVTICMMLITIPSIRSIGLTLIASAGLAGLAVGAAAQPALKNLIAGIQLAFTEPIRLDDVVIIDGEWGRIEEIRLTFVVVKTWDERRLVVPIAKILEDSFQNWTRQTSQLLGTVFVQVDQSADVSRIRGKFEELAKRNPKWDGRVAGLQVTDVHPTYLELRGLVSAGDAGKLFDLRCDVREALMRWLADEMPEALPRRRAELALNELPQEIWARPATHRESGRATR